MAQDVEVLAVDLVDNCTELCPQLLPRLALGLLFSVLLCGITGPSFALCREGALPLKLCALMRRNICSRHYSAAGGNDFVEKGSDGRLRSSAVRRLFLRYGGHNGQ